MRKRVIKRRRFRGFYLVYGFKYNIRFVVLDIGGLACCCWRCRIV